MKKLTPVIVIFLVMAMLFTSCEQKLTTYTSDTGISVDMPAGMTEQSAVNFTYMLQGLKVIFMANKELKSQLAGYASNLDEYFSLIQTANGTAYDLKDADGVKYFTYEAKTDKEYFYLAVILEGTDAFWLCNFACAKTDMETYEPKFIEWAKTIKVN